MSSLDRAKRFLQNKTKTLALTVVPFAALIALTPPAKASVLSFDPSTPTLTQTAPSGSFITSNLSSVVLGVSGVAGSGNGTLTNGISGSWSMIFDMAGSANSGSFIAPIPVDWLFNFTSTTGSFSWALSFKLNGNSVDLVPSPDAVSGIISDSTQQIAGTALIPVVAGPITSYDFQLQITTLSTTLGTFTLDIPAGSTLDINPVDSSAPEPSAFFLAAPGLALLLLKSRRKQLPA